MPSLARSLATAALLVGCLPSQSFAHTWIEEFQVIGDNGTYTGDRGYSRGFMGRTDPGFDGFSNMWLLPSLEARNPDQSVRQQLNGSDLLCHPAQRTSNYTQYPMLKASPGEYMAMKYLENGHVTLPWTLSGKPKNGGTVLVFGTTKPDPEEKIVDVLQWTQDGKGGDGRGFLMASMDYDDGECHQINTCWVSGERQIIHPNEIPGQDDTQAERWCESDVKIPEDVQPGKLTVYWVWDWGTEAGVDCLFPDGKAEIYTNCADIEIVASGSDSGSKVAADADSSAPAPGDPNTRAVKDFASRTAINTWKMTTATAAAWADFDQNKVAAASSTGAQNASWASYCSSKIQADQVTAANPQALPASCPAGSSAPTGAEWTAWSESIKQRAPTGVSADSPGAEQSAAVPSAPAPTTPPLTTTPATAPDAAPSASAPAAPAPSQSDAGAAPGAVTTVTETQVTVSTVYVSSGSAPAASAPAPSAPAEPVRDAPAAAPAGDGFPTVSVINNPNAGMTASALPSPPVRPHARAFRAME